MRRVPNHLQVKVIKWFDYLWLTQKCSDEERAVSCLPDKLKVGKNEGEKKRERAEIRDGLMEVEVGTKFTFSPTSGSMVANLINYQ